MKGLSILVVVTRWLWLTSMADWKFVYSGSGCQPEMHITFSFKIFKTWQTNIPYFPFFSYFPPLNSQHLHLLWTPHPTLHPMSLPAVTQMGLEWSNCSRLPGKPLGPSHQRMTWKLHQWKRIWTGPHLYSWLAFWALDLSESSDFANSRWGISTYCQNQLSTGHSNLSILMP